MPDPLIRFEKVEKAFGDNRVLRGFDLEVPASQRLCLIGPSGSGKSTILRLLMTLEEPTGGRILLDGETLWPAPASVQDRLRLKVGMVFQHFNLFPHLKVRENLALAPRLVTGLSREEAESRGAALLEKVGLSDKADAYPGDLSGGQKQRVAIARALSMEPKVMLFDEATSSLDPELVGEVLAVIQDLAETTDMTMLFVTHQLHFVRRIAGRVVVLDGGRLVEDGPPDRVLAEPEHERTRAFLKALEMI